MSIRIRPELRAMQVEEAADMVPALTLYFDEKYDLGDSVIPESCRKVDLWSCVRTIFASDAEFLDVPEPLWLRFAAKNLVLTSAWKVSGLMRRRTRKTVTYAIENNAFDQLLGPKIRLPKYLRALTSALMGLVIRFTIDRIVFGSTASRELYHSLPGVKQIPHLLVEELPSPQPVIGDTTAGQDALFIGELDDRKGILNLMSVWHEVEAELPTANLKVIGTGRFEKEVQAWCNEKPLSRKSVGFIQHSKLKEHLAAASILIAPSQRRGRWREQIGLPITEGLSAGLTIVTTDETGLADWLRRHGHHVVPARHVQNELSTAIVAALREPVERRKVVNSLPRTPGRIQADALLHDQEFSFGT